MPRATPTAGRFHPSARGDQPEQNADGSTDLYLGPSPAGKEHNWLRTVPGKGYFTILRLYSPTQAALDKSWKPGDVEKVN